MMRDLRKTKIKGWYEYVRQTCPICFKTGGCMINEKGDTVVCTRTPSDIVFSTNFQSWIHRLNDKQKVDIKKSNSSIKLRDKLEPYMLNYFFRELQKVSPLNGDHQLYMMNERKMSLNEISIRGYISFPEKPWEVAKKVLEHLPQIDKIKYGIPGFYKNQYGWTISGSKGIMIPYRNEYNDILGYQIRIDHPKNDVSINRDHFPSLQAKVKEQPDFVQIFNSDDGELLKEVQLEIDQTISIEQDNFYGTVTLEKGIRYFWLSSSSKNEGTGVGDPTPIHIAVPTKKLKDWDIKKEQEKNSSEYTTLLKTEAAWITEGALKADIAIEHICKAYSEDELEMLGKVMIGIPGVNNWRIAMSTIKNMGIKRANLAFDMDAMRNDKVAYQLKEFIKELKKEKIHVALVLWNISDGKGIDDLFSNHKKCTIKQLF